MLIEPGLHLVASGASGFDLTDRYDAHVWLFAGTDCNLLFDAGAGRSVEAILANGSADGLDWSRPTKLFLTHGHADHSGGAAELCERLSATTYAGATTAEWFKKGDDAAISLPAAKAAGIYPQDYRWRSCPIECPVVDREIVELGGFSVQAVTTPGHSADHVSWLVRRGARTWLVAGDALFHGGRIVLQHIYDCDIAAYARSLRALAELEFDALLPGHGAFSLHHAVRHAKAATDWLDRLLLPPQLA
ncbi:MAG: MBL fold metallo-hydrolase [Geminicoccaceae bacterium]